MHPPIAQGQPAYMSDALAVINPNDPYQDISKPRIGVDQKLTAKVRSSAHREKVHVQFWVCAFGTAGTYYLASAGGTKGLVRPPDDLGANFTLNPPAEQVFSIDWKPLTS